MKRKIIFMLVVCYTSAFAQTNKKITSIHELTDSISVIMKQRHIPGLMLGIVTKDSVLFSGGLGYADLSSERLVNNETLFRMGSVTKSFVAIGILQLIQQGKLNLDDELKKIAPELPFENDWETTNPVTIVNLLEHTTGFDDFKLNRMYALERKNYSTKAMMLLQKNSMICRWKPSDRYSYCNVNYAVLGYIISKLTGEEYEQYLIKHVLNPINMSHSNFDLFSKHPLWNVKEYSQKSGKIIAVPSVSFLIGPAGALWSNADDMTKFVRMFLRNGSPLLTDSLLKEMETPHSSLATKAGLKGGYGLGNEDLEGFRGHTGQLGACKSSYRYNRDLGVGFVVSSNGNGLAGIEALIASYLTQKKSVEPLETIPLDHKAMIPYLGFYQVENPRHKILGFTDRMLILKVEIVNDTLYLNILGKKRKILPTGPLTFANPGSAKADMIFFRNGNEKSMVINDRYCEKTPAYWAILKRLIIAISLLMATLTVIPAAIGIISAFRYEYNFKKLTLMCLPMTAVLFLSTALLSFNQVVDQTYMLYKFGSVNLTSVTIFLGTFIFAILSTINIIYLIRNTKYLQRRFMIFYMFLTGIALVTLTTILLINDWIGLCTWAM